MQHHAQRDYMITIQDTVANRKVFTCNHLNTAFGKTSERESLGHRDDGELLG